MIHFFHIYLHSLLRRIEFLKTIMNSNLIFTNKNDSSKIMVI